eukprot:CAMPEP_0116888968 /NCGR_PEP_ID=MMETSP0463-20121206/24273_1 /TAXON_ID=181622 /ORGANISM="Strombidinopsis sp, Strain SopsisLIS2011" /LENGTH=98 /DNA_ID=CAMNT_0004554829 /DNA_START=460 /DNA_END=756 /DNA_ORIENTATION=+
MPYWLKLLEEDEYRKCHLLILQFVLVALSVSDHNIALENYNILDKNNGIQTVLACINIAFKEIDTKDNQLETTYQGGGGFLNENMSDNNSDVDILNDL